MNNVLVIMYDYDGTLAYGNIQEPYLIPTLMPELKDKPEEFWQIPNRVATTEGIDTNNAYMNVILETAKEKGIKLTLNFLRECGSYSNLFPHVLTWFDRVNNYAKSKNIIVKHYIISSGNLELLQGTKIAKYFSKIYACRFSFDRDGSANGIGVSVDNHQKLKYIDEIRTPEHLKHAIIQPEDEKISYQNMVFIGDGATDVPSMKIIASNGGHSFGIYTPAANNKNRVISFEDARITNHSFSSDNCYKKNSALEKNIFKIIDRMSRIANDEEVQMSIFDFL